MAQLIVMVCLLGTPEKCQEFTVEGASTSDVVSCIKQGGDKSNDWQAKNSQYFVIGWRCVKEDKPQ